MKLALDPHMFRTVPLLELPGVVADLGYEWIELSPRDDVIPIFTPGSTTPVSPPSERRWRRPESASPRCCRCSRGPAPTRRTGRPRCATGSGPSTSPPTSARTR